MPEKTIKKRTLKTKILREMLLYPGKKHKDTIFEKKKKKRERASSQKFMLTGKYFTERFKEKGEEFY